MSACPAWCAVTHGDLISSHMRHWLIEGPVTVSLALDDNPRSAARKPKIIIQARGASAKGIYGSLLAPGDAAPLAEVFRVLGHADVADAITEAVSTAKEAER